MSIQDIIKDRSSELLGTINQVGEAIASSVNLLMKEGKVDVDKVANSFIRLGELSYTMASEIILSQKENAEGIFNKITHSEELLRLSEKIIQLEKEIENLKKRS